MISVSHDLCIGCGACASICPDVFRMDDAGKSEVISQDNSTCAQDAAASCPVQAISVN